MCTSSKLLILRGFIKVNPWIRIWPERHLHPLSLNKIPSINSELKDDTNAQAVLIKKSREISPN